MMTTVRQMLAHKKEIYTVPPDASVLDALRLMADKNIGAVLVVEGDRLAGILSERDYARKVVLHGKSSKDTPVREIMSSQVFTVEPAAAAGECMALMTQQRVRHLPVMEQGHLVGVISIGDVVKAIVEEQEFTIHQLENYIYS